MKIIKKEGRRIYAEFENDELEKWQKSVAKIESNISEEIYSSLKKIKADRTSALNEKNFSGQIRQLINKCEFTEKELAQKSGISLNHLRAFMCGYRPLNTDQIDKLYQFIK